MARTLTARVERFPVRGSFVIARGAKTHVDVVVAAVRDGAHAGRGEATAIYYRGESAQGVAAAVLAQVDAVAAGASRADLLTLMPAGAARNALEMLVRQMMIVQLRILDRMGEIKLTPDYVKSVAAAYAEKVDGSPIIESNSPEVNYEYKVNVLHNLERFFDELEAHVKDNPS